MTPVDKISRSCIQLLTLGLTSLAVSGCSDLAEAPIGQLQVALSSGLGDSQYVLRNAHFEITGDEVLQLDSEDELADAILERSLPTGEYLLRLLDGWQLIRPAFDEEQALTASLLSDNPQSFTINTGNVTGVVFRFQTTADVVEISSDGRLSVGIEVNGQSAVRVIFSELMSNPTMLPDSEGEWFELFNAGQADVDLGGCNILRDNLQIEIPQGVIIQPGTFLTLANSPEPGFSPDVAYSGLSLPNSGSHQLALRCDSQILNSLDFDSTLLRSSPGHSVSLSASALLTGQNDDPNDWCQAVDSYNGDFGSPNAANQNCGTSI